MLYILSVDRAKIKKLYQLHVLAFATHFEGGDLDFLVFLYSKIKISLSQNFLIVIFKIFDHQGSGNDPQELIGFMTNDKL